MKVKDLTSMRIFNPNEFHRPKNQEAHKQEFVIHDGHTYRIDVKLVTLLKAVWALDIKTRFSCQHLTSRTGTVKHEPYFQLAFDNVEEFKNFINVVDLHFSERSSLYSNLWDITSTTPWVYDVTVFSHECTSRVDMMYFLYIPLRDKNALVAKFRRLKEEQERKEFLKLRMSC